MKDLEFALKEKQTEEHNVIDEAIRDQATVDSSFSLSNRQGYTVFSVPVGAIYRPSEAKIKNAQKKDYLGEAKLIAATDAKDGFTGFTGAEIKKVFRIPLTHAYKPRLKNPSVPLRILPVPPRLQPTKWSEQTLRRPNPCEVVHSQMLAPTLLQTQDETSFRNLSP